jgi:hypothetical protein
LKEVDGSSPPSARQLTKLPPCVGIATTPRSSCSSWRPAAEVPEDVVVVVQALQARASMPRAMLRCSVSL